MPRRLALELSRNDLRSYPVSMSAIFGLVWLPNADLKLVFSFELARLSNQAWDGWLYVLSAWPANVHIVYYLGVSSIRSKLRL